MDKMLYQIRIKESEVNDYILGRISGMLDLCMYAGTKVKSADVLYVDVDEEWIFNCEMECETYLKIRNYITACYPDRNFEYFKIVDNQRVEA